MIRIHHIKPIIVANMKRKHFPRSDATIPIILGGGGVVFLCFFFRTSFLQSSASEPNCHLQLWDAGGRVVYKQTNTNLFVDLLAQL